MKRSVFGEWCKAAIRLFALVSFALVPAAGRADQIQMQNGDHYAGTVVSVTSDTVVLRSEVLGTIRLPRSKVATVGFGANAGTNFIAAPALTNRQPAAELVAGTTGSASKPSLELRQLGSQTNLIRQVQEQFLGGAGPEANAKFTELLNGLSTGNLNMNDLRAQASSAAAQLRASRRDLGDDAGGMLDGYLAILDSFLKESATGDLVLTNSLPAATKP
jgi:hypothetical protein